MNSLKIGDQLELKIDRLSYDGGRGVGRYQGLVIFVAQTAPEEIVKVEITSLKKNFAEAELISITENSKHRRKPPCPVADRCGGCVWQHVDYAEQLKQKQNLLIHQLKRVLPENLQVPAVIASPDEFRYRNRVQVQLDVEKSRKTKQPVFGFFAKGSNELIEVSDCLIAKKALFDGLSGDPQFKKACDKSTHIRVEKKFAKIELAIDSRENRDCRALVADESEFTQVNTQLNKILRQGVAKLSLNYISGLTKELQLKTQIYDLYCGSGNLSFALLDAISNLKLIGVEANSSAVERAKIDLQNTNYQAEFLSSDVGLYLQKLKSLSAPTIFVLDPPRAGLDQKTCDNILRLSPHFIIYVSCSLPTLSRDLAKLNNYTVEHVQGFDMFPQTEYLETVVALRRNS